MGSSSLIRDWARNHLVGSMESYPLDHQGSFRTARFIENSKVYSPDYKTYFYSEVLWPSQQVGIESGQCTVWEEEIRDRIKISKMELRDSWPLGSTALFFGATSLLFSVLACRKYLLCYDKIGLVSPVTSPILLITLDHLCYFFVQGVHPTGVHRPTYALEKHLGVCTSSVLKFHWPGILRSTLSFSLA